MADLVTMIIVIILLALGYFGEPKEKDNQNLRESILSLDKEDQLVEQDQSYRKIRMSNKTNESSTSKSRTYTHDE